MYIRKVYYGILWFHEASFSVKGFELDAALLIREEVLVRRQILERLLEEDKIKSECKTRPWTKSNIK